MLQTDFVVTMTMCPHRDQAGQDTKEVSDPTVAKETNKTENDDLDEMAAIVVVKHHQAFASFCPSPLT